MGFLRFKLSRRRYALLFPVSFVVIGLLWCVLAYTGLVKPFFLPSPSDVVISAKELLSEYNFFGDIWASIYRVLWGFFLSVILGAPLGLFLGVNKHLEACVEPFVDFIRYMPIAGFVPLCILWLGIGDVQKIAIIFIGTFFQFVPMVMNATSNVPSEFLDTARTLGAQDGSTFRRVIVPNAMPGVYDAMRVCIGISWTYLIVAEIVAASSGIGHVIIEAQRYLMTARIFVGIGTVGLLGLATDYAFKFFRSRLFPWSVTGDER